MEVLYKSKNFIVINKPVLTPSQSDLSGDEDAMSITSRQLENEGEGSALWLVHRLDRVVGGLMVFARNKKSAAQLSELIAIGDFVKEYVAVVEGECQGGEMRDFIYKDARLSKAFVTDRKRAGVKEAVLSYDALSTLQTQDGARTLVKVSLLTGRYHQIRAQFSSRKLPLVGDGKYGSRDKGAHTPALFSHRIKFTVSGETVDVKLSPDKTVYPWSLWRDLL